MIRSFVIAFEIVLLAIAIGLIVLGWYVSWDEARCRREKERMEDVWRS